jgi:hypothetical protein
VRAGPGRGVRPSAGATLLVRAALAVYPPSWRARYGDEVRALLDDSGAGAGAGAAASLAARAIPAWFWPSRHLYDRADPSIRMRASLATVLIAASMLAGLGLVFAQLTQLQGYRPPGHPVIGWCYAVFDAALAFSALAAVAGGLPLWLLMLRRAHRERRPRDFACLLAPVIAPAVYLLALMVTVRSIGGADGVSPWWFLAVTLAGFAAAGMATAGPGVALRRLRPRGSALHLATVAAALVAAVMLVATTAIVVAVIGLCLWAPGFAGYHDVTVPGVFLALVVAAAAVTAVSAARGTRAAFAKPSSR